MYHHKMSINFGYIFKGFKINSLIIIILRFYFSLQHSINLNFLNKILFLKHKSKRKLFYCVESLIGENIFNELISSSKRTFITLQS